MFSLQRPALPFDLGYSLTWARIITAQNQHKLFITARAFRAKLNFNWHPRIQNCTAFLKPDLEMRTAITFLGTLPDTEFLGARLAITKLGRN